LRQEAAVALASEVDRMIVVGGLHSANTRHLFEVCQRVNPATLHIETAAGLTAAWLGGAKQIGVTAGASTPEWIIEEVETKVSELEKENYLETPNQKAEEAELATETSKGTGESSEQGQVTMAGDTEVASPETAGAMLEQLEDAEGLAASATDANLDNDLEAALEMGAFDLPRHSVGDVIKATVVNIRSDEVMVDVGLKSEGVIPRRELSFDPSIPVDEIVKVGDEIEVMVLRSEDQEGRITFSKKRADQLKHWDKILEIFESGEIIEGKVIEAIKGGLWVNIGVRGFMPASHAERRYTSDLKHLVGQTVKVKLLEVEREKHRAIVSRKFVLDQEAEAARQEFWGRVSEGDTVRGKVQRLTEFGAFVDLGGVDGLLHISDMAYHRVNKPSDIVAIGDELELRILRLDPEKSKVSLGLKQMQPRPWEALSSELMQGDVIEGTVVRITAWGAFVNVRPGIDGLIHISELDNQRVAKVDDIVQIGDVVRVVVLGINPERERLSLSLKALKEPQLDEGVEEGYDGYQEEAAEQLGEEEELPLEAQAENPEEEEPQG